MRSRSDPQRISELLFFWCCNPDLLKPEEWNELQAEIDIGLSPRHALEIIRNELFFSDERGRIQALIS